MVPLNLKSCELKKEAICALPTTISVKCGTGKITATDIFVPTGRTGHTQKSLDHSNS